MKAPAWRWLVARGLLRVSYVCARLAMLTAPAEVTAARDALLTDLRREGGL